MSIQRVYMYYIGIFLNLHIYFEPLELLGHSGYICRLIYPIVTVDAPGMVVN